MTSDPVSVLDTPSNLPTHVLDEAFGKYWERLDYPSFCAIEFKSGVRVPESASVKALHAMDIGEWCGQLQTGSFHF